MADVSHLHLRGGFDVIAITISMSQKWIRGPICGVDNCRSQLYRSSDGLKVCQYGHVMEGNIEINDDQDENYVATRRLNINLTGLGGEFASSSNAAAMQSRGITKNKDSKKLYGVHAKKLYLRCFQLSLQHKIKAIVTETCPQQQQKEFEHSLVAIVKVYWARILIDYMPHINGNDRKAPSAIDALAIIYLAILRLNHISVYLVDLIPKINDNTIPYMRSLHLLPKEMVVALPSYYHKSIQPPFPVTISELLRSIRTIASKVGQEELTIPKSYYYSLVFSIMRDSLLLPNTPTLFCLCIDIAKSIDFGKINPVAKTPDLYFPETVVLSLVILIVSNTLRDSPFSTEKWLSALDEHEQNSEFPFAHKDIEDTDLLKWSDFKVEKYCQWLYNNIVPAKNKIGASGTYSDELSIADKRLFQIFSDDTDTSNYPVPKLDTQQDSDPTLRTATELVREVANSVPKKSPGVIKTVAPRLLLKFATALGSDVTSMKDVYNYTVTLLKRNI
ncbi:hypothetical protein PGUG_03007 [Meyerozyma guilliermondii ATCC 6260]|uniref:Uncharacterized protein n=1 Tax=Meyerozyma guilliermondii (strain ATCC 6260 / CBS 566 / DSM 6381 / JCM 1539 / NBRC 10279 / NRRL Y-324) TaxID=294746 RepID=A5DIA6_PICGU|nr:uncharacterized protein PGUG_03007 [Meyerozyma guilliermondii ATCC 6260]EDK38909.2 hypothetical protein PGUG_03007 [Meyerozyma guilliermondii ATCC 6260]